MSAGERTQAQMSTGQTSTQNRPYSPQKQENASLYKKAERNHSVPGLHEEPLDVRENNGPENKNNQVH